MSVQQRNSHSKPSKASSYDCRHDGAEPFHSSPVAEQNEYQAAVAQCNWRRIVLIVGNHRDMLTASPSSIGSSTVRVPTQR